MAHGWHALVTTDQAARWPDGVGFLVRQLHLSESLVQTITTLSQYYHGVSWSGWTRDTACNNQGDVKYEQQLSTGLYFLLYNHTEVVHSNAAGSLLRWLLVPRTIPRLPLILSLCREIRIYFLPAPRTEPSTCRPRAVSLFKVNLQHFPPCRLLIVTALWESRG